MLPAWPSNTREQIEEIIGKIGRNVEFYYIYSSMGCPVCTLDPVTDTSTDSFCPTCSGEYWIHIFSGASMSGHITWKFEYENDFSSGGKYLIGDARVKVIHTSEREQIIKNSDYVVVDNKIMDIEKVTLLGAQDVNRIVVDLKEREE